MRPGEVDSSDRAGAQNELSELRSYALSMLCCDRIPLETLEWCVD